LLKGKFLEIRTILFGFNLVAAMEAKAFILFIIISQSETKFAKLFLVVIDAAAE
jgi:hypothetical protein